MAAKYLIDSDIKTVIRLAPLVSIDLIIRDGANRVLLGLRNNEPAKGYFFVPGGIILKDEPLADAFTRIMKK
jgi:colanic acid biosynthesis protein WcaH